MKHYILHNGLRTMVYNHRQLGVYGGVRVTDLDEVYANVYERNSYKHYGALCEDRDDTKTFAMPTGNSRLLYRIRIRPKVKT